jgi:hypothetical protein
MTSYSQGGIKGKYSINKKKEGKELKFQLRHDEI